MFTSAYKQRNVVFGGLEIKIKGYLSDAFVVVATAAAAKACALFVFMYVARVLGGEEYGKYQSLVLTLMLLASPVQSSVMLFANKNAAEAKESDGCSIASIAGVSYVGAAFFGLVSFFLLVALSRTIAVEWLQSRDLAILIAIAACSLPFSSLSAAQSGLLAGVGNHKASAMVNAICPLLALPLVAWFSYMWGVLGTAIGFVVQAVLTFFVGEIYVRANLHIGLVWKDREIFWREMRRFFSFCVPITLSSSIVAPANWIVSYLLVSGHGGFVEMAIYGVANQWRQSILFVPASLGTFITSHLARRSQDKQRHEKAFRLSVFATLTISLASFGLLALFSGSIMAQYGSDIAKGRDVLLLMGLSAVFISIANLYSRSVASLGHMKKYVIFDLFWAAVIVALAFLLIPELKSVGAAIAAVGAAVAQLVLQIFLSNKKWHVK